MFKAISLFWNSNRKTKSFIFNVFIYMVLLIGTTIYCYARLDFVRSGQTSEKSS